jgi:hypothetical protein
MPKRKVEDVPVSVSKYQKEGLPNIFAPVIHLLTTGDILASLLVCKHWRDSILENLESWCINLATSRRGFLSCEAKPETHKRNCFLQLFELYKRNLLSIELYHELKAKLRYTDGYLEVKHGQLFILPRKWSRMPSFCNACCGTDFLGVKRYSEDTRVYPAKWYAHLKSLSEDFQTILLRYYAHSSLRWTDILEAQLSPKALRECQKVINWDVPLVCYAKLDPHYLWSVTPILKKCWKSNFHNRLFYLFSSVACFHTHPLLCTSCIPYVQHYFPLLLKLCACPDDATAFFKKYEGGLTDECFDQLIKVMPSKTVKKCLDDYGAKCFQVAMLSEVRRQKSVGHWIFCFNQAQWRSHSADVSRAFAYLLKQKKFFITLVQYHHSSIYFDEEVEQLICRYSPGEMSFPGGVMDIGMLKVGMVEFEVDFIDVYENLLALLPIRGNSILCAAILREVRADRPLPPVLLISAKKRSEIHQAQKLELQKYLSPE